MRMVYILGGVIAFALGTVGTVLPVLPTVPFYLLATWCFAKSSRRLHDWLHARTLYQKHMMPFFNGEGLSHPSEGDHDEHHHAHDGRSLRHDG